ncbi:hypothetical protein HaLaN_16297 [Haematococcus lacustris]|uniref:Uncharacterized protein n=1 Tax=Haematococcus lacustris TaxID=44745 RepID=A0A699ZDB8_HAELA|nr:hypothetical protein HaLaN_16297 [Haematococcus lacustris]
MAAGLWQPRDFANVQWAMGRMGVTPSPSLRKSPPSILSRNPSTKKVNHPSNLDELSALSNPCRLCAGRWGVCWSAASLPHLPSFEGRHLAMALWGLASCQVLPSPAWHCAACLRAQQLGGGSSRGWGAAGSSRGRRGPRSSAPPETQSQPGA